MSKKTNPSSQKKKGRKSGPSTRSRQKLRPGRVIALGVGVVLAVALMVYGAVQLIPAVGPVISQITNNEKTAPLQRISHAREVEAIKGKNVLDEVNVSGFSDSELRRCFYSSDLDEKLIERLKNMGYADQIPAGSLKYVRVLYHNFEGKPTVGELVVNSEVANAIENVFFDLFLNKYQIGKMILPDAYGTRIAESYADNNTVGLCFGLTDDNGRSLHESGYAIDLNPLYNPLIKDNGMSLSVFPMEGQLYLDRTVNSLHFIHKNDYAVEAFAKEGFVWKGQVRGLNDYKHFEYAKAPSSAASSQASSAQSSQSSAGTSHSAGQSSEVPVQVPYDIVESDSQQALSQPSAEPVPEQPALPDSTPQSPAVQQPPVEDPGLNEQPPVVQDPGIQTPTVQDPVIQDPVTSEPAVPDPAPDPATQDLAGQAPVVSHEQALRSTFSEQVPD